ncbi:MAG: hypothetical protein KDA20_03360 [Phycisphaerales bacterium]|nr:hypothetical protein [Phycisphaerales bacterium]
MGWPSIIVGLILAVFILSSIPKLPSKSLRPVVAAAALVVLLIGVMLSSVRFVPADRVGIVTKNALGARLAPGKIIATDREMGVQADVLAPGWHFFYWPVIYSVDTDKLVEIREGSVGLVESVDGRPLAQGQVFADEVAPEEFDKMIRDAKHFLTTGGGQKGPQTGVLRPGTYRINTAVFKVTQVPRTDVASSTVAVLKSNVGGPPTLIVEGVADGMESIRLAKEGEKGVRTDVLAPGSYPINPQAYEVNMVSTATRVANYAGQARAGLEALGAITVKSSDGFSFPVDVRVAYQIQEKDAPKVVASLGGDNDKLQQLLTSRIRSIFRNNAEKVKALDYVQQRSRQETQSTQALKDEMTRYGVTVERVEIGEVGSEETLGALLKTQKDREIALQEQITFEEQQRAAEKEKELKRTVQEAEEERRLATASYEVKIAEQEKEQRIIAANAEAEAIRIKAEAEAKAYQMIAQQIGPANLAMIELLKIVGERGINITPRVFISGAQSGGGEGAGSLGGVSAAENAALIGTILDAMVAREEPVSSAASPR